MTCSIIKYDIVFGNKAKSFVINVNSDKTFQLRFVLAKIFGHYVLVLYKRV